MNIYPKIPNLYKRDPKTDHKTLIKGEYSHPEFEYLKYNMWRGTEKIDGTNIRVIRKLSYVSPFVDSLEFRGRTDEATIPEFLERRLQQLFTKDKLHKVFEQTWDKTRCGSGETNAGEQTICLYGEGYGNRIQKAGSRYLKDSTDFILFDVKIGKWWLKHDALSWVAKQLGIPIAPQCFLGTLAAAVKMVKEGFTSCISEDKTLPAEGLIIKPAVELRARNGARLIAKLKTEDF